MPCLFAETFQIINQSVLYSTFIQLTCFLITILCLSGNGGYKKKPDGQEDSEKDNEMEGSDDDNEEEDSDEDIEENEEDDEED